MPLQSGKLAHRVAVCANDLEGSNSVSPCGASRNPFRAAMRQQEGLALPAVLDSWSVSAGTAALPHAGPGPLSEGLVAARSGARVLTPVSALSQPSLNASGSRPARTLR